MYCCEARPYWVASSAGIFRNLQNTKYKLQNRNYKVQTNTNLSSGLSETDQLTELCKSWIAEITNYEKKLEYLYGVFNFFHHVSHL